VAVSRPSAAQGRCCYAPSCALATPSRATALPLFIERHDDKTGATVIAHVERPLAAFAARGITVRRLMTEG
jgi:hypothetical protein